MITKDLINRLRDTASKGVSVWGDLQMEAAKEIETLLAERECYASAMDRMQAALAEPEGEPSTVLRLIDTIKYLVGIAERGEGRKARDDELPEQFVLGYVKRLEAALAEPSEPVAEVAGDYNTKHIIFLPAGIALEVGDKLFTHPASKPEPLTDEEIKRIQMSDPAYMTCSCPAFARQVEAAVWAKFAAVKQDAAIKEKFE